MESTTKTTLSFEMINKLVQAQFGSTVKIGEITELTAGWFNTAYEIRFANHTPDAVLRIAPHPEQRLLTYEQDLMRKELLVYKTIQQAAKIPIPRLLGYDMQRKLIDRDYMFTERLSGIPLTDIQDKLTSEDRQNLHRQIGEVAAGMQNIKGETFGYFGNGPGSKATTWREAFMAFTTTLLADGEALNVALPLPYSRILDLFTAHANTLDEIQEATLVHWDLWPGNIFVIEKDRGLEIEGIIDWERAYWGDSESEPAIAIQYFGKPFYQGYGRELTTTPSAAVRHKMYHIYLLLVMKIEAKVRFENADHLSWVQTELSEELNQLRDF
jgi:fructosamine-3-kinase